MYIIKICCIFLTAFLCISAINVESAIKKYSALLRSSDEVLASIEKLNDVYKNGQTREVNELIEMLFECIRELLITGNSTMGIPSLNPFKVANVSLDLSNIDLVSGNADIYNLEIAGLTGFKLIEATVKQDDNLFYLVVNLLFENIYISTGYSANVDLFDTISINADQGTIDLNVPDVQANVSATLNLSSFAVDIDFKWDVGNVTLSLTGLLNDEYMNTLVGNMLASIINEILHDYKTEIEALIAELLSQIEGGDLDLNVLIQLLEYFMGCLGLL